MFVSPFSEMPAALSCDPYVIDWPDFGESTLASSLGMEGGRSLFTTARAGKDAGYKSYGMSVPVVTAAKEILHAWTVKYSGTRLPRSRRCPPCPLHPAFHRTRLGVRFLVTQTASPEMMRRL